MRQTKQSSSPGPFVGKTGDSHSGLGVNYFNIPGLDKWLTWSDPLSIHYPLQPSSVYDDGLFVSSWISVAARAGFAGPNTRIEFGVYDENSSELYDSLIFPPSTPTTNPAWFSIYVNPVNTGTGQRTCIFGRSWNANNDVLPKTGPVNGSKLGFFVRAFTDYAIFSGFAVDQSKASQLWL